MSAGDVVSAVALGGIIAGVVLIATRRLSSPWPGVVLLAVALAMKMAVLATVVLGPR